MQDEFTLKLRVSNKPRVSCSVDNIIVFNLYSLSPVDNRGVTEILYYLYRYQLNIRNTTRCIVETQLYILKLIKLHENC